MHVSLKNVGGEAVTESKWIFTECEQSFLHVRRVQQSLNCSAVFHEYIQHFVAHGPEINLHLRNVYCAENCCHHV